jgi:hypothetical protein
METIDYKTKGEGTVTSFGFGNGSIGEDAFW